MTWIAIDDPELADLLRQVAADDGIVTHLLDRATALDRLAAGEAPEAMVIDGTWGDPERREMVKRMRGRVVAIVPTVNAPVRRPDQVTPWMQLRLPTTMPEIQRAMRWLAWDGDQVPVSRSFDASSSRARPSRARGSSPP